jgi:hypothetical protein
MSTAQSNQYSCEGFTTRPHIFLSCLLLLFVCSNLFAQSKQKRQPSTPAERAQAAQIARELETDPLLPDNENMRAWLKLWLGEVPDITIQVCAEEFGPFSHEANRDQKFGSIIFGQSKFSSASFVIEHPTKPKTPLRSTLLESKGHSRCTNQFSRRIQRQGALPSLVNQFAKLESWSKSGNSQFFE